MNILPGLAGAILAATVAVIGWWVAYRFAVRKDLSMRRREIRVKYLIDAHRQLRDAAGLPAEQREREVESALADIHLFGSGRQIAVLQQVRGDLSGEGSAPFERLLHVLRSEIRQELGIDTEKTEVRTGSPAPPPERP